MKIQTNQIFALDICTPYNLSQDNEHLRSPPKRPLKPPYKPLFLYSILNYSCQISMQNLQKLNSSFTEIKSYSICYFLTVKPFSKVVCSVFIHTSSYENSGSFSLSGFDIKIMLISKLAGKCLPPLFTRMCEKG